MLHRPLVGAAWAVVVGMLIAALDLFSLNVFILAAGLSLLISFFARNTNGSGISLLVTICFLGACRFMMSVPDSSRLETFGRTKSIQLIGRIADDPAFYSYSRENGGAWSFVLKSEGIFVDGKWMRVPGRLDARVQHMNADLLVERGDRVKLTGRIDKKTFPGRNALEINVSQPDGYQILSKSTLYLPIRCGRALRDKASGRLELGMENFPDQEAILKALVLGFREEISQEHLNRFKRTGSLHIFAISGLHVGIVGLLIMILLKVLGISRDRFWIWLLPLLGMYVISTGMKSSALRALTMAAVFILSPIFRRKPDVPISIAAAALILLLFQPLEIMSAGFIFSFIVVICIVMVYSAVPARWMQGRWIRNYVVSLVVTSFAASLASIPLAALYFGTFSPVALLGNLLVVPLTFCIVVCGWLSMLVPWTSEIFNYASVLFISLLLKSVEWLDRIPMSSWSVSVPPMPALLLWFGSLLYLFTHAENGSQRRYALAAAACAVVLVLIG